MCGGVGGEGILSRSSPIESATSILCVNRLLTLTYFCVVDLHYKYKSDITLKLNPSAGVPISKTKNTNHVYK